MARRPVAGSLRRAARSPSALTRAASVGDAAIAAAAAAAACAYAGAPSRARAPAWLS